MGLIKQTQGGADKTNSRVGLINVFNNSSGWADKTNSRNGSLIKQTQGGLIKQTQGGLIKHYYRVGLIKANTGNVCADKTNTVCVC